MYRTLSLWLRLAAAALLSAALIASCDSDPDTDETGDGESEVPAPGTTARLQSFIIPASRNPSLSADIVFNIDQSSQTLSGVCIDWAGDDPALGLIPVFTFTGEEVRVGETVQQSGITANSFAGEVQYTVVAGDGTQTVYTAILFLPRLHSQIPVFRIEASAAVGDDYVDSAVEIIPNGWPGETWDFDRGNVEIRLRGNSTRHLPKQPYRLKFGEAVSPLGLDHANEKSWVLIANDCDKTLLRNAIGFELSRVMYENMTPAHDSGVIPFTPASIHVDVYLDGQYKGIYQFTDQMQRKEGRIEVDRLRARDEGDPEAITGGYVLEIDIHAGDGDLWFASQNAGKITMKYPDDDDYAQEQFDYIVAHVTKAEEALYADDFASRWRGYFDEATIIDYVIINELCGDPDAYTSIWFYKRRGCDKFYFGPVWDFDSGFDNDNRVGDAPTRLMIDASFKHGGYENRDHWVQRMWQDPAFRLAVQARWNEMKYALLDRALWRIDHDVATMGPSVGFNYTRWDIRTQALDTAMPPPSDYDSGIAALKQYLRDRYSFLDGQFNALP
ncbi:MAG: CotH kinase family protein [Alistipes sp.]|nr:CotH kinase family protein [Alistipes sp.]